MSIVITLMLNGLANGMLIFLIAIGVSVIFGLMGIMNFAHGALFMWGAYAGVTTYLATGSFLLGIAASGIVSALWGLAMERLTLRQVYGNHLAQILVTMGALLVLTEAVKAIWGPNIITVGTPTVLRGGWEVGGVIFLRYKLLTIGIGLGIFAGLQFLLNRTRLGMMIRAGVENPEMVRALGIKIRVVFSLVFALGAAVAGISGMILAVGQGAFGPDIGLSNQLLAFIVVVVGGLGSVTGTLIGAVLVGVTTSFMAYFLPDLAMAVNVGLMALLLLVRPQGLFSN